MQIRVVRVERLLARRMDEEDIDRRMSAQPPRQQWLRSADQVIDNSGPHEQLVANVDSLWEKLQELAES